MKITNELLDQYMDLQNKIDKCNQAIKKVKEKHNLIDLQKDLATIKILLEEKGSFSTHRYIVAITEKSREGYTVAPYTYKEVHVEEKKQAEKKEEAV